MILCCRNRDVIELIEEQDGYFCQEVCSLLGTATRVPAFISTVHRFLPPTPNDPHESKHADLVGIEEHDTEPCNS